VTGTKRNEKWFSIKGNCSLIQLSVSNGGTCRSDRSVCVILSHRSQSEYEWYWELNGWLDIPLVGPIYISHAVNIPSDRTNSRYAAVNVNSVPPWSDTRHNWEKIEGQNSTLFSIRDWISFRQELIFSSDLKAHNSPFFHYLLGEKSVKTGEISNHAHLFHRVQCMLCEVVRAFWGALRTFCIRHADNR
jgi:hypothetical protein